VCRGEGELLHLSKIVLGVTVQYQFTNWDEWVLRVGPDLERTWREGGREGERERGREGGMEEEKEEQDLVKLLM